MDTKTKILRVVAYAATILSVLGTILSGYLFGYNPTYDNIWALFVNVMWVVPLIIAASNKAVRNAMLISLVTCILNFCWTMLVYSNSNALTLTEVGDLVLVSICTIVFPLAWIYSYSIISSNAELASEKRNWISLLSVFMLLSVFVQFTSVFCALGGDASYMQSAFYTGGMYNVFVLIMRVLWLIAWYKIIFSDAFAGYKDGAEEKYDYRFFNRYTLAYLVAVTVVLPILAFITLRPLNL